jgi:hypothetical protein
MLLCCYSALLRYAAEGFCARALSSFWRLRLQRLRRAGHVQISIKWSAILALARCETPCLWPSTGFLEACCLHASILLAAAIEPCWRRIDDNILSQLKQPSLVARGMQTCKHHAINQGPATIGRPGDLGNARAEERSSTDGVDGADASKWGDTRNKEPAKPQ